MPSETSGTMQGVAPLTDADGRELDWTARMLLEGGHTGIVVTVGGVEYRHTLFWACVRA